MILHILNYSFHYLLNFENSETLSIFFFFFFFFFFQILVNLLSLLYDVDRWLSGRVLVLHSVFAVSISRGGNHVIHF